MFLPGNSIYSINLLTLPLFVLRKLVGEIFWKIGNNVLVKGSHPSKKYIPLLKRLGDNLREENEIVEFERNGILPLDRENVLKSCPLFKTKI